jgi:hypothetical protein
VSVVQQFGGSLAQTLQGVGPGVRRGERRQATAPVLVSEQLPGDLWHQGFLVLLGRDRPPSRQEALLLCSEHRQNTRKDRSSPPNGKRKAVEAAIGQWLTRY